MDVTNNMPSSELNLKNGNIKKIFLHYAFPSLFAMLGNALYLIVDGIFIGRGIGANALAVVTMASPVMEFILAFTIFVCMGASTIISMKFAQNKVDEANNIFSIALLLMFGFSITLAIFGNLFLEELALMLGATELLLGGVKEYLFILCTFSFTLALSYGLSVIVRNDGNPRITMIAMVIGAITNITLDYVFIYIFKWGITGAAIATSLGQIFSVFILLSHFILKKGQLKLVKPQFSFKILKDISTIGVSAFIQELSLGIVTFTFTVTTLKYLGEIGVSAYGIIAYVALFVFMAFLGIAQGIQPIVSYNHGANEPRRIKHALKLGLITNLSLGILFFLICLLVPGSIAKIFASSDINLISMTIRPLQIYAIAFIFTGMNITFSTYFLAVEEVKYSNIVSLSRSVILTVFFLLTLPVFMGPTGIWLSIILSEAITLLVAFSLYRRTKTAKVQL